MMKMGLVAILSICAATSGLSNLLVKFGSKALTKVAHGIYESKDSPIEAL